jgi:hypothetical protein
MARVFFVHWNETEAESLVAPLRADCHELRVHFATNRPPSWEGFEPTVAVISLERLPAHGREIADWIWSAKKRRHVPVVFVGGKPDKVLETKGRFPDAVYCRVDEVSRIVEKITSGRMAAASAPENRVKTSQSAHRPSTTPLARKLGIVAGTRFALVNAPQEFMETLAPPREAMKSPKASPHCNVIVFFARSSKSLATELSKLKARLAPAASLWLAWPKKTSALKSDLSDEVVRQLGLRSGLVDVKVCAIDETWSGLKFMHRVADRPK